MTLHKIDREKLGEVLKRFLPVQAVPLCDEDFGLPETFLINLKAQDRDLVIKTLQNWFTITDPKFELSEAMVNDTVALEIICDDNKEEVRRVKRTLLSILFKEMIAKAGE